MRGKLIFLVFILSFLLFSPCVFANSEYVYVQKVLDGDDKGIIVRQNGEVYLIEKGIGCLSFWQYEDKKVVINSPGLFAGIGSYLILPDHGEECRILDIEVIDGSNDFFPTNNIDSTLQSLYFQQLQQQQQSAQLLAQAQAVANQQAGVRYCSHCGKPNQQASDFCVFCGQKTEK